jgi:hypothetical protein
MVTDRLAPKISDSPIPPDLTPLSYPLFHSPYEYDYINSFKTYCGESYLIIATIHAITVTFVAFLHQKEKTK